MDSMTEVAHLKCLVATFALMHKMEIGEVSLEDFRSISLIKSVCKILAEALASRLRRRACLSSFWIKELFVHWRQVLDVVSVANECGVLI